ncbi:LysR family transcriptional regulator [Solirubrobacter sp. CPCC 204708]|uniref:LysR family transcriptional regulator n=1 Tax=Solirubrobacter deserti TaxID=2282478 RepID=A0ABT4RHZ8_9ACTN|nr:LysR family transcriptional regulator [Solirubrobacter deserti]MBE2315291.1 LysR family transcriptional regulator [Solirubrobacter deserti]MDA0137976.1 LysR family transcriptional regulator [Solirubrobacter deserti]
MAEIRQLRYVLAVAEHGSVSRAATELHLSQSALSETLRKLEVELGVQLFTRGGRGVTPTAAGEALVSAGAEAVRAFDAALDAARGQTGRLRVGFEATGAGRLSTQARARFLARFPHVRVEPRRYDWGGEVAALREGETDVAFVWLPADLTGLKSEIVASEPRFAGLACDHPLARRAELAVDELNDEPIMWTRRAPRYWVDWWAVNPRPSGAQPRWGPENDNVEEMLEQVADGSAYCIVGASMTTFYARPDLAWVPIADIDPLRVALAWRQRDANPLVAAFAAIVRELTV